MAVVRDRSERLSMVMDLDRLEWLRSGPPLPERKITLRGGPCDEVVVTVRVLPDEITYATDTDHAYLPVWPDYTEYQWWTTR